MKALLIVDVQNDFTEGGALGVEGGIAVARSISSFLREHAADYGEIIASRDWHNPTGDNGGHFALDAPPNFVDTWPVHCVAGTTGAEYHPDLDTHFVSIHLKKGQGKPAYSMFEGLSDSGETLNEILHGRGIDHVDVVGIATDYCVRASALDALGAGVGVTVLTDMVAAVNPASGQAALAELVQRGATLQTSS